MKVSLITGQQFGYWTVVELDSSQSRDYYICKCKCGVISSIRKDHLLNNKTKSCGCSLLKYIISAGQKFNQWLVLEESTKTHQDRLFLCKCDCGAIKQVSAYSLASGESKSCGCYRENYRRKNKYSPAFNYKVNYYKKSARRRKLLWELSDEDCLKLFKSNCYYCGYPPSEQISYKKEHKQLKQWEFLSNGIDRLDNTIGYTINNVVTACTLCNEAKKDHSLIKFKEWIERLVKFNKDKL